MQVGTSGPRGRGMKWSTLDFKGQRSSDDAEIGHKNLFRQDMSQDLSIEC